MDDPGDGRHRAIERLVHRYAWLIDHGDAGAVADLFVEDGRLHGVGPDKVGRAAIGAWGRQRAAMADRRSRHVQTNLVVEPLGGGTARGWSIVTVYRHDGGGPAPAVPVVVGDWANRYRRGADGAWRFEERRLTVSFGDA